MVTKTVSKLTTLAREHSAQDFAIASRDSVLWLKNEVRNIRNPVQISNNIYRESNRRTNKAILGGLYFFFYDPKHADTLPYYDVFPLTLVLEKYNDGFLGLNFHYLPMMYRAAFLDKLLDRAKYDDENDIQRIRITYEILSASRRYKAFKPCLKRYLYSHMGSKLLKVEPHEWETALFLPVERFKKEKKMVIQKESVKEILTGKV